MDSTLMTSAPSPAGSQVAAGPAGRWVRSRTLAPFNTFAASTCLRLDDSKGLEPLKLIPGRSQALRRLGARCPVVIQEGCEDGP